MPPRFLSLSRLVGLAAQTFVPVAGAALRHHIANIEALNAKFSPMAPLLPGARIFILAPHPDDETLGAGGLILKARAAGLAVQIGFLSNGDGSRTTQISQVLRGRAEKTLPDIARLRQLEAIQAARKLGVDEANVLFFGFPDGGARPLWEGGFSAHYPFTSPFTGVNRVVCERAFAPDSPYCREALVENLAAALRAFAPTLVLTTHPLDTHPDHAVAYRACEAAIAALEASHRPMLRAFLIHFGIWPVPNGFHPDLPLSPPQKLLHSGTKWLSLPLSPHDVERKKLAVECHRSQIGSTPRYLRAFVRRSEIFGEIS